MPFIKGKPGQMKKKIGGKKAESTFFPPKGKGPNKEAMKGKKPNGVAALDVMGKMK